MNNHIDIGIPNLEEYYGLISIIISFRSSCLNRAVGAVLVSEDNKSIVASGYNSPPSGLPHCVTCRRREEGFKSGEGLHRSRSEHAERSVLNQVAKYGRSSKDCILYVTHMPCTLCSQGIIGAGIKKVCYINDYPGTEAKEMLSNANIEIVQLNKEKILNHLKQHVDFVVDEI